MQLADRSHLNLNPNSKPDLQCYLDNPRSQVAEMIRQVNQGKYYEGLFEKDGLTFLDLGANIGIVSLFAAPKCSRLVAVEAEPITFGHLQQLVSDSPFRQIECLHAAIAPRSDTVRISVDPVDYSCHTITNPKPNSRFAEVQGFTLCDLLSRVNLDRIDVCKVDVEGAEMDALTLDVIQSAPVKCWYIEVHKTPSMTREKSLAVMLDRLKSSRFICSVLRSNAIIAKL